MTVKGTLFVQQMDHVRNSIKWQCWGDAQTRLDLIHSEWVSFEEMSEEPAFQRIKQILNENGMCYFGPEPTEVPQLLGGKGFHVCFLHPRLRGLKSSEMPRMMPTIPMS